MKSKRKLSFRVAAAARAALWVALLVGAPGSIGSLQAQSPPVVRAEIASASASAPGAGDVRVSGAQPVALTLQQAVQIALEKNPLRKAALAEQKAAAADVREARSGFLPHIRFTETATDGNDPVYAFGTRLRQGRFREFDFGLDRLNHPDPIGNFSTRFGGEWNLFDSFATWAKVRRANRMRDAASQHLARSDQETIFRAITAYYGLLLAHKQLQLAQDTVKTSGAILKSTKARYDAGLVVESDYLSSEVNDATRRQELIRATNNLSLAQAQLTNALGIPADIAYEPTEVLAERSLPQVPLEQAEKDAIENRPDLKQVQLQEAAQSEGVTIARATFGPRINAFGSWGAENPNFFGGGGKNWMAGLELQLDLFTGGAKSAQLAREQALQERIAAMREAAVNNVRLDVRRAWYDADASRRQLEVARASIAQSEETLRISHNRYGAGLTTITELLRSEEAARRSRTDYWQAVYNYQTAFANLQLAMGTLNAQSPVVSQ
ncbi:MAG: TolC family protein [Terriglobales bacterium]